MDVFVAPFRLRSHGRITARLKLRAQNHPKRAMLLTARPRHIAVVTETAAPEINGVAHTLTHLSDGLADLGYRITLIRPRRPDLVIAPADRFATFTTPSLPIPGYPELRFGLPCRNRLRAHWSTDIPDLVHVATEGPLGASAIAAARDLGIPVTSSFHTHFENYCAHYRVGWMARHVDGYLRRLHNRTALTLAPTRVLADQLTARGYRNVDVLGRGIDSTLFHPGRRDDGLRQQWGLAPGDLAVLYVGRLAAEKNLGLLCDAFSRIAKANPSARLVVVGDGPRQTHLRQAVPDAVFAGVRTGIDLATHYASADLFLFPSLTETYGNVIVEAMASGLPVVAYDRGAASEWIVDGENGACVATSGEAARTDFLYAALELAADRERRSALGQQAARIAESARWPAIVEKFSAFIDQAYRNHLRQTVYRGVLSFDID